MIAVTWTDRDAEDIARLHQKIFEGAEFHLLRVLRRAGGETLARAPATEFQRPRHAVTAFGMRVLHDAIDAQRGRDRAAPANDHA